MTCDSFLKKTKKWLFFVVWCFIWAKCYWNPFHTKVMKSYSIPSLFFFKHNRSTIYTKRCKHESFCVHVAEPYYEESRLAISEASLLKRVSWTRLITFEHVVLIQWTDGRKIGRVQSVVTNDKPKRFVIKLINYNLSFGTHSKQSIRSRKRKTVLETYFCPRSYFVFFIVYFNIFMKQYGFI